MEIEKGAVVMTVSPQSWLKQYYVNRSVAAGRLTRFWGYVSHYHEDNDETQKKTQSISSSHPQHPLSQGSRNSRHRSFTSIIIAYPFTLNKYQYVKITHLSIVYYAN